MKQVLLMRHAKSGWDDPMLKDFDRPLSDRGVKEATETGSYLKRIGCIPDVIISSSAERARHTSMLISKAIAIDETVVTWNSDFYHGTEKDYLKSIRTVTNEYNKILLIGHNPLLESTAGLLAGAENKIAVRMCTAAIICLEAFANKWEMVYPGTCQVKWMMTPETIGIE